MTENDFRTNVVKWIRDHNLGNFVWVNEARSKRGFPDLTIIFPGHVFQKIVFAELKICHDKFVAEKRLLKLFAPIQLRTIEQMIKAGATVWGLVYFPKLREIAQIDFRRNLVGTAPVNLFRDSFRTVVMGKI